MQKFKYRFMDIWTDVSAPGRLKNVPILETLIADSETTWVENSIR